MTNWMQAYLTWQYFRKRGNSFETVFENIYQLHSSLKWTSLFFKIKNDQNYLRSFMGHERLCNLTIISIEHSLADKVDFDKITSDFTNFKCRKVTI